MKRHYTSLPSNLNQLRISIFLILVIFSVLAVLIATLYPFNFSLPDSVSRRELVDSFDNNSFFKDQVNNVLLFLPLGFGLTGLLQKRKFKLASQIIAVILASAGLSLTVELLQILLPSRAPTPADIFNNTCGGFLGLIGFYVWNFQSFKAILQRVETSKASNSRSKITLFFTGYIILTFLITIPWQATTNLSGWNSNFPLIIGNETTANRGWEGYISQVNIANQAFSKNEVKQIFSQNNNFPHLENSLLASYEFTGKAPYRDRTGKQPDLQWYGESTIQNEKGVLLSPNHWLKTATPVTSLSESIRKTSAFTISTTVTSTKKEQTGPARIISLSQDSYLRNFTLGQQGSDLVFRVRTPLTGANASDVKLEVPHIFDDLKPHQIVITYSKSLLTIYVDKVANIHTLNLLDLIPKEKRFFYYGLTFIPLGLCLTLLTALAKRKLNFYRWLLLTGILLPSLILEGILVQESGKNISPKNLFLGILFTAGTMLILKVRTINNQQSTVNS
ncbi:MAG: VanZ family protein [Richelia sp. SL_2_1]|nr:VanZ family protein [Richelia sp. SM2_1_7]NJM18084.1 VanZ family protein [Richelia sp. SM1_7_0]NJN09126.1 VanZ family protein [Richelia sp. RM1_1_1]NJO30296.1 VanZ family protein [Richelia sp. SL_2_1]